jgi:hypothetical protein
MSLMQSILDVCCAMKCTSFPKSAYFYAYIRGGSFSQSNLHSSYDASVCLLFTSEMYSLALPNSQMTV